MERAGSSSDETRLKVTASEIVYAVSYGEGLFHWSGLVERSGRGGVDGSVALAAGGGMAVEAEDGRVVLGDDTDVEEFQAVVDVVEVGAVVGGLEVGGAGSWTSPRRHVETEADDANLTKSQDELLSPNMSGR